MDYSYAWTIHTLDYLYSRDTLMLNMFNAKRSVVEIFPRLYIYINSYLHITIYCCVLPTTKGYS